MKVAIVTTVRRYDDDVEEWIRYHAAIGFDLLYVFCDEPCVCPALTAPATVIQCNAEHWNSFSSHSLYQELDPRRRAGTASWSHPQFVMLRQMLNAESALSFAANDGASWLLHIDGDEAFYSSGASLAEHFSQLDSLGISVAKYLNMEAVVSDGHCHKPFTQLTIFKRNPATLSQSERLWLDDRLSNRPWFLAYTNGKSAVKVMNGATPYGVHGFRPRLFTGQCVLASPAILHYPYTTCARFHDKHKSFGNFDSAGVLGWMPPALMSSARECLSQGDDAIDRLYQEWVLMESETIAEFYAAGVLERILAVSDVLH